MNGMKTTKKIAIWYNSQNSSIKIVMNSVPNNESVAWVFNVLIRLNKSLSSIVAVFLKIQSVLSNLHSTSYFVSLLWKIFLLNFLMQTTDRAIESLETLHLNLNILTSIYFHVLDLVYGVSYSITNSFMSSSLTNEK